MRFGKVLVVGAAEAGKSTLVGALCPEAVNLAVKGRTVAMDHATLSRNGMKLSLVGVPGQARFEPVREALAVGAKCAVWVHREGSPTDPHTASLVARLARTRVPYLVYVNRDRGNVGTTDWPDPLGMDAPRIIVGGCLLERDESVDRLVEEIWSCIGPPGLQ